MSLQLGSFYLESLGLATTPFLVQAYSILILSSLRGQDLPNQLLLSPTGLPFSFCPSDKTKSRSFHSRPHTPSLSLTPISLSAKRPWYLFLFCVPQKSLIATRYIQPSTSLSPAMSPIGFPPRFSIYLAQRTIQPPLSRSIRHSSCSSHCSPLGDTLLFDFSL